MGNRLLSSGPGYLAGAGAGSADPLAICAEAAPAVGAQVCLPDLMASTAQQSLAWDWFMRGLIISSLFGLLYVAIYGEELTPLVNIAERHGLSRLIVVPSLFWAVIGLAMVMFRTLLWFRYRPIAAATIDEAPLLTVIIPAYNEGAMVRKSIASVANAAYPRDRLEILVVDDGSRDDTWQHIEAESALHAGLVTAVRFPENRGKRAALEAGFRRARGEVVVTIDSDSVIERMTLLAMAGPFRDARVGAVAGRVLVYNLGGGYIPRMLRVQYTLAFDFLRAVQSMYRTVYCCPGALAGYRTVAVRSVLDDWMAQTFAGVACTYGEDRSMTNFILREGYDTVYQRTGLVYTVVPQKHNGLVKMYLRWDRSYVREEIRLFGILWKRPLPSLLITLIDRLITNLRYPVWYLCLGVLVYLGITDPLGMLRMLVIVGVVAGVNMLYYLRSERSWDFVFGILYAYYSTFGLFWLLPYAALTVRAKGWLTR